MVESFSLCFFSFFGGLGVLGKERGRGITCFSSFKVGLLLSNLILLGPSFDYPGRIVIIPDTSIHFYLIPLL